MLRCCENALHDLAEDETTAARAVFCYRVHFKARDLTLGNIFYLLTGPGNDVISQVLFPSLKSLSLTLSPCVSLSVSDASQRHQQGTRSTKFQIKNLR